MLFFLNSFLIILLAEGEHAAGGGFAEFYERYLNYPGFEAWKFINLAIFVAFGIWLGKKSLGPAFIARREAIRADLIKAEKEKQEALARLTAAESKLAALESEKRSILEKARSEAEEEKLRIIQAAEAEAARLRQQVEDELARLAQRTKIELRRFSAEESIRRAEDRLRGTIDADKDSRLVKAGIDAIGGLN